MESLYQKIKDNNKAYSLFVAKWNSYGNNTGTGTQFCNHYSTLRPTQIQLVEQATTIIRGKLDFIPEFARLLSMICNMHDQLQEQIQAKRVFGSNIGTGIHFASYINKILQKGLKLEDFASFLLKNEDFQFLSILNKKGLTLETIEKLRKQNIRREILKYLTDEEMNTLGMDLIGDKIILRLMIEQARKN